MKYKIMVDSGESVHELPESHVYNTRQEAERVKKSLLSFLAESLRLDDTSELIIVGVNE